MAEQVKFGANVNEVGINTALSQYAERKAQDVAVDRFDYGKAFNEGTKVALAYKDAEDKSDTAQAKADYLELITSSDYRDTDSVGKAELIEKMYDVSTDTSEAYKSSLLSYSAGEYGRQYEARNEIEVNAKYNTMPSYFEASGQDPETFVAQEVAKDPRLNPAQVRDSIILGKFQKWGTDIMSIDIDLRSDDVGVLSKNIALAEQQLGDALKQIEEEKKPFKNPKFLTTKEKKAQAMVEQEERGLMQVAKQKQEEIKEAHYAIRALGVQSKYRLTPEQMNPHIDATASNEYASMKAKKEYYDKYQERKEADVYTYQNPIGQRKGALPDNSIVKEERQDQVTSTLINTWNKGDMVNFVRIADNEGTLAKDMGQSVIMQFNSAETNEELQALTRQLKTMEIQPSGSRVMRNMFTDKEYARIKGLEYLSIARPGEDLATLRSYMDQRLQDTSKVEFDPDTFSDIQTYARKLGSRGYAYLETMNTLQQIDPSIAEDKYEEIYKTFNQTIGEHNGIKVDTSIAPNPSDASLNPERADALQNEQFNVTPTSKTYLHDDIVVAKDEFGGQVEVRRVTNVNDVVDKVEMEETKRERSREEEAMEAPVGSWDRAKAGIKATFKSGVRTASDKVSRGLISVKDFFKSLDPTTDKTMPKNMKSQLSLETVQELQDELVIELPEDFSMLSKTDQLQVRQAIEKNKVEYKLLEQYKTKLRQGEM